LCIKIEVFDEQRLVFILQAVFLVLHITKLQCRIGGGDAAASSNKDFVVKID